MIAQPDIDAFINILWFVWIIRVTHCYTLAHKDWYTVCKSIWWNLPAVRPEVLFVPLIHTCIDVLASQFLPWVGDSFFLDALLIGTHHKWRWIRQKQYCFRNALSSSSGHVFTVNIKVIAFFLLIHHMKLMGAFSLDYITLPTDMSSRSSVRHLQLIVIF